MNYSIIERLRARLRPQGTAPVVLLRPMNSVGIEMHADFVTKCIDELEQMHIRAAVGDMPTNLEKLAYQLLLDSAYIDQKREALAGSSHHAGDGGYSIGTQEKYEEFVKKRNEKPE